MNGEYRGESNLVKLMHDFNCTKADDMNFKLMADQTRYLKENPKGVSEMCRIMEDMRNESLKEGIIPALLVQLERITFRAVYLLYKLFFFVAALNLILS